MYIYPILDIFPVVFSIHVAQDIPQLLSNTLQAYAHFPLVLEKWFPLQGERAHSLKLFCMYDKRFEISKTN